MAPVRFALLALIALCMGACSVVASAGPLETPSAVPTSPATSGRLIDLAAAANRLALTAAAEPSATTPPTATATPLPPTATRPATNTPAPTRPPTSTDTPRPTHTPKATSTPRLTNTPKPPTPTRTPPPTATPLPPPREAVVLAKYYPWFDETTWVSGKPVDLPAVPYNSADRRTIERQVAQARAAGIDGFTLNWWGRDNPTDTNLQTLLDVAGSSGFRVTVDFDLNSPFWKGPDDLIDALAYLRRYYAHPAWLKVNGHPAISFYATRRYPVATWATIRRAVDPNGEVFWIGEGDIFSYLEVFDGIHPYSVAWSPEPGNQLKAYARKTRAFPGNKLWVATVMPGYDDTRLGRVDGFRTDRQGGAYYRALWQAAIETRPTIISVTSWNEWMEGSQIEPSREYGNLYLQITREMSAAYKQTVVR